MAGFNINMAGFIIVGMFVVTLVGALAVWHFGNVEEKWSAKLTGGESVSLT
jgi:high-affinity nickel-transport protein